MKIKFKNKKETLVILWIYQKNRVWVTHTRYDNIWYRSLQSSLHFHICCLLVFCWSYQDFKSQCTVRMDLFQCCIIAFWTNLLNRLSAFRALGLFFKFSSTVSAKCVRHFFTSHYIESTCQIYLLNFQLPKPFSGIVEIFSKFSEMSLDEKSAVLWMMKNSSVIHLLVIRLTLACPLASPQQAWMSAPGFHWATLLSQSFHPLCISVEHLCHTFDLRV